MEPSYDHLDQNFQRYTDFDPLVPVWKVSIGTKPTIHRFFDTSPLSPSGRYLALTEFETDKRPPEIGESAEVVVIDLKSGGVVFRRKTFGWDTQLGAQVQWGTDDSCLLFNDMDTMTWTPYGVVANIQNGSERHLEFTIYMASHDGREALSPCLRRIANTQPGYGVNVPPEFRPEFKGASTEDGVYRIDLETGAARLWLSVSEILEKLPDHFTNEEAKSGDFYVFHVKWSPDDTLVMIVLRRRLANGKQKTWLICADRDGKNMYLTLGPEQWLGGHHPNWCPNSKDIIMNVVLPFRRGLMNNLTATAIKILHRAGFKLLSSPFSLRFVKFRYDGSNFTQLSETFLGSGHPTWNSKKNAILTDAYPHEPMCEGDGSVPIRWITNNGEEEACLVRMPVTTEYVGPQASWRVDPHPAWDRTQSFVVINGAPNGQRSVFLLDMTKISENS
ncbi:hypothetical protein [Celeribacter sp.]|uniref:hypothetical protein n=1 Tax=Celeribacter sp. TaxID=1890673 RepID=UPI003A8CB115